MPYLYAMTRTKTTQPPNRSLAAPERYAALQQEAQQLLKLLEAKIKNHGLVQAADPLNWGYVGDMAYIVETLTGIVPGDQIKGL